MVSHDERSLLPLSNILQGSTIITTTASRQQQQPEASLLLSAIEHVFALKCQQPDGLESCTLKQFLTAIQANFPTIAFLKETRLAVRERVTFLVKQHIANKKKATTTITLAHLTKTNVSETNVEIPPPTRRKQPDETVVLFETKEFYRVPTTNNKKEIEEISAPNITNPSKATGQYGCHSPPSSSTPKSGCDMDDTAKNINDDSMVPIARVAQSINQTAPIIAKPKQPRARRGKNAACQHSGTTVVESCNPMESVTTTATIIAPPPPRGRHVPLGRRVETKARCNLCTKCPCQHKARESSGSRTSLDFAQTDAAIERALIKRLLKLEMVTDQYDEQTDAARRQLKKHRREIWKKREEKRARDEGTNTASVSRFLPDAEECQHLALDANRNKRHRATIVANAKENLFGVRSTTNQQTLTQMLASGKESGIEDPESRTCEDHTLDDTNGFVDLSSPLSTRSNIDKNSTICATISANIADGMRQPVSPLYSIGEPHSALKPPPKDASEYSSLWDAVRLGHCESSWDLLFVDKSEEAHGVDHLLGLLGGDQNEAQPFNSPSQSSISAQGQSLAAALTERIGGNSKTLSFLEQWCPNWRENVAYAMRQKNKVDIADALHNVKDRQARLKAVRKELWRKLEQEEAVLKVFQESLEQSLTRFATPQPKDASGEGFFLSQREPCSPFPKCAAFVKHRQSFESEVGTIIATAFSPSQNECAS